MPTIIYPSPIFGPVKSRRLGISLGINLLPADGKVCTFDCIYCECGLNATRRTKSPLPTREEVAEARKIYEMLATDVSNVEGAESAYRVIEALFTEGKHDESETRIYALADSKTPHSYWLGKAFILLGDIYVARNDLFQAKATYRSVVDGYTPTDDGIVAEAQSKLEKLN